LPHKKNVVIDRAGAGKGRNQKILY